MLGLLIGLKYVSLKDVVVPLSSCIVSIVFAFSKHNSLPFGLNVFPGTKELHALVFWKYSSTDLEGTYNCDYISLLIFWSKGQDRK